MLPWMRDLLEMEFLMLVAPSSEVDFQADPLVRKQKITMKKSFQQV